MDGEVWYRYESGRYAPAIDEFGDPAGPGRVFVTLHEYPVQRHTPKGVWLDVGSWCPPRFVLREARKRWACPTPEEAAESFRARKRKQLRILRSQIQEIEQALMYLPALETVPAGDPF